MEFELSAESGKMGSKYCRRFIARIVRNHILQEHKLFIPRREVPKHWTSASLSSMDYEKCELLNVVNMDNSNLHYNISCILTFERTFHQVQRTQRMIFAQSIMDVKHFICSRCSRYKNHADYGLMKFPTSFQGIGVLLKPLLNYHGCMGMLQTICETHYY